MAKERPTGLLRLLFRAPVWLYRARLGFLLGSRFLMIEHRGRSSGRLYRTVVEVVGRPGSAGEEWLVVSGFGPRTDWYRNLREGGLVAIWLGSRRCHATARFVEPEEAAGIMLAYETEHPTAAGVLQRELGLTHDGTAEGRVELMSQIPMVGFTSEC
ncbi:MAG TPA: nitroreductase family deazaflavin-dependent oxidoreductase [Acidimicrobiia bacterium]|nr:nitroreductase family deazaflavin-dependent oxidoreductase [Acidimicrobiia bacterium]